MDGLGSVVGEVMAFVAVTVVCGGLILMGLSDSGLLSNRRTQSRPRRRPMHTGHPGYRGWTYVLPPAGWYPDPCGQPGRRYWDGQRWNYHYLANRDVKLWVGRPRGWVSTS